MDTDSLTPRWETWSPSDVSRWVATALDLPQYAENFRLHEVDGPTLLELTEETLENPLGIAEPLRRKKILGHIKLLKIRSAPTSAADSSRDSAARGQRRPSPRSDASSGHSTPRGYPLARQAAFPKQIQHFARSNGLRQGQGCYGVGSKTPRSISASSDRLSAMESARTLSMRSLEPEGSVYSDYISTDPVITGGLVSSIGVDSPSYSRLGNFARSRRKPQVFPNASPTSGQTFLGHEGYDPRDRFLRKSPRATMGRATRNTGEYVAPASASPGVGKYDTAKPGSSKNKGHLWDSTPRLQYEASQVKTWLTKSYEVTPGPSDYRPHRTYDSTFAR